MAFRTSWMVKGRFPSCLLWAWLKTRGRRSILALVSASSVSWVGVCCRRKLSWVAWSTVSGSVVREPSSCRTVVTVRWPVSVMASLRWQMALYGSSCCAYRSCSWAICCCLWMCHRCRSALMWAICVLQWCIWRRVFGGVGVEEGRQLLLRMPEVTEHVP